VASALLLARLRRGIKVIFLVCVVALAGLKSSLSIAVPSSRLNEGLALVLFSYCCLLDVADADD